MGQELSRRDWGNRDCGGRRPGGSGMSIGQRPWKNKLWAELSDGQGAKPGSGQGMEGRGHRPGRWGTEADGLRSGRWTGWMVIRGSRELEGRGGGQEAASAGLS